MFALLEISQTYIYIYSKVVMLNKKYIINELSYIMFYYRTEQC